MKLRILNRRRRATTGHVATRPKPTPAKPGPDPLTAAIAAALRGGRTPREDPR